MQSAVGANRSSAPGIFCSTTPAIVSANHCITTRPLYALQISITSPLRWYNWVHELHHWDARSSAWFSTIYIHDIQFIQFGDFLANQKKNKQIQATIFCWNAGWLHAILCVAHQRLNSKYARCSRVCTESSTAPQIPMESRRCLSWTVQYHKASHISGEKNILYFCTPVSS